MTRTEAFARRSGGVANTPQLPQTLRSRRTTAIAVTSILASLALSPLAFAGAGDSPARPDAASAVRIVGQVPSYSPVVANEEGYWYSRYSMMTLTMQSGLGVAIPMDQQFMAMIPPMIAAVGATPADPVMLPVNPALLQVIYAGGNPHYVSAPNQMDFGTLRWIGGPAKLTTYATASTMTKELEWAKMFHRYEHFGQPGIDSLGSGQRFAGMLFATMVKAQLQSYLTDRAGYESSKAGDYALLTALSDGAGVYSAADLANNQGPNAAPASYPPANRYADPAAATLFAQLAKIQFAKVLDSRPSSARDFSRAVQSVIWYASISKDPKDLANAKVAINFWGNRLVRNDEDSPAALAYKVRGLIEAGRVTGSEVYLGAAANAFNRMTANFDFVHGVLNDTKTLSVDDVGEIAGAFNSAQLWLGTRIDQVRANNLFGTWWGGTVDLSGLEISSPVVNQMKGTYELLDPPGRGTVPQNVLDYRYPTVPLPETAGGVHGIAPVLAASVAWDADEQIWHAATSRFDTAGAMHAATEMMWFHSDEVSGFPTVKLP